MTDYQQDQFPEKGPVVLARTLMFHIHWVQTDDVVGTGLVAEALREHADWLDKADSIEGAGVDDTGEWTSTKGIVISWLHGSRIIADVRKGHIEDEANADSIAAGQPDPFFAELDEKPHSNGSLDKVSGK